MSAAALPVADHHCPPEPCAIRSIIAPHMGVLGSYRDMLSADVGFAGRMMRDRESITEECVAEWMASTGPARMARLRTARLGVESVRAWRRVYREALMRLASHLKEV